jgi:hypothetical protein
MTQKEGEYYEYYLCLSFLLRDAETTKMASTSECKAPRG